ncbi:MAG: hypothetical protein FWE11_08130 [Defluviitaleaceae bacterium]|nr:hypothetical protein [Defluviitaleaceae bacterium]
MKSPQNNIKLRTIDLLPEDVQKQKGKRSLIIKLAAAQVAIFLFIALMVIGLNLLDERAAAESRLLIIEISTLRQSPESLAIADTRQLLIMHTAEEAFFNANPVADFNPEWLRAIIEVDNGHFSTMSFDGTGIMLTGISDDFSEVELIRQQLEDTEVFSYVWLGNMSLLEGYVFFDLRINP